MAHLINRLRFEVNCDDEDLAFNLRQNFAQTFQLQIASVIDKVCTQYVPENEWVQIDKVEIDLGQLSPGLINYDFEKTFLHRFEKELIVKLSAIPAEKRSVAESQSKLELLKYFLQNGLLPWWGDEENISLEDVCNNVFANSWKQMEQFFLLHVTHVKVWQRAAFQFEDSVKMQMVQMLEPLANAKELLVTLIAALIAEVNALPYESKLSLYKKLQWQPGKVNELVIATAPAIFTAGENQLQVKVALAKVLLHIFDEVPVEFEKVKIFLNKILGGILTGQPWFSGIQESDKPEPDVYRNFKIEGDKIGKKNVEGLTGNPKELMDDKFNAETEIEKIMVKGAGIILLAPFFIPFFKNLHLIVANQWVNRDARVKAIYLLNYLGTGNMQGKEYQLVLEKLLCGMPINEPLEPPPEFTEAETTEAEQLLGSVLEHWKQLKNTSVNGLRESFFKRDGILTPKQNNWQLQVERKTMDVLLDSIPWGFSTITLPWNEYIIFTEW